jgi:hypothetical protein
VAMNWQRFIPTGQLIWEIIQYFYMMPKAWILESGKYQRGIHCNDCWGQYFLISPIQSYIKRASDPN